MSGTLPAQESTELIRINYSRVTDFAKAYLGCVFLKAYLGCVFLIVLCERLA